MGGENGTIWVAERVKKDVNAKRTTHFLKHAWIGNRPALKKTTFFAKSTETDVHCLQLVGGNHLQFTQ